MTENFRALHHRVFFLVGSQHVIVSGDVAAAVARNAVLLVNKVVIWQASAIDEPEDQSLFYFCAVGRVRQTQGI